MQHYVERFHEYQRWLFVYVTSTGGIFSVKATRLRENNPSVNNFVTIKVTLEAGGEIAVIIHVLGNSTIPGTEQYFGLDLHVANEKQEN